jgi:HK97 family phage major capsid protein
MAISALVQGQLDDQKFVELCTDESEDAMTTATKDKLFSKPNAGAVVRVKAPSEQYSEVRYSAKHAKLGVEVEDGYGNIVTRPSQRSLAKTGALLKFSARKAGIGVELSEHDNALLSEAIEQDDWASFHGEPHENKVFTGGAVKASLIDDSVSGGLEVVPIEFDADVISFPLLNNELLPLIDLKPVARGRRIESASVGTPTAAWGQYDGTAGTLYDSTSLVAPLDTTVFEVATFVEVGRNFLEDSPVNVGALLTQLIGERFARELDRVIAAGNGTTEPQGITVASGTTSVSFGGVAATVTGYESLLFAVPKQYRMPAGSNFAFCANEVTYRRARSIAVSGTDQRRVFGMDHEGYALLARPYKISPDLPNTKLFSGALSKYRMYRRLGMSVEWSTQGETLMRSNLALLVVRARYGGRVMDANAFAVVSNAEA